MMEFLMNLLLAGCHGASACACIVVLVTPVWKTEYSQFSKDSY